MSLTYPEDRSYHSEHLWAKAEPDGTMLVGITDYAQDQLGGVIFVDLPPPGPPQAGRFLRFHRVRQNHFRRDHSGFR